MATQLYTGAIKIKGKFTQTVQCISTSQSSARKSIESQFSDFTWFRQMASNQLVSQLNHVSLELL